MRLWVKEGGLITSILSSMLSFTNLWNLLISENTDAIWSEVPAVILERIQQHSFLTVVFS